LAGGSLRHKTTLVRQETLRHGQTMNIASGADWIDAAVWAGDTTLIGPRDRAHARRRQRRRTPTPATMTTSVNRPDQKSGTWDDLLSLVRRRQLGT
jgi:hypothetical protein